MYVFHDNQWYDMKRRREYLYGRHEPVHMTPDEMDALRELWDAGLGHMISDEGRRALARHRHQSALRDVRRRQRLWDLREQG